MHLPVLSVDLDDSPLPTELTFCRHGEVLETREGILQSEDGTMLDEVLLRLSSS